MAKPKKDCTRVNIYLPDKVLKVMRNMAARRGVSYSELARNGIVAYLREELERERSGGEV